MQPHQRRVLGLRNYFTAYGGFYVALADSLSMPLLGDDHKFAGTAGPTAATETWG